LEKKRYATLNLKGVVDENKHRYAFMLEKIDILYSECEKPQKNELNATECCNNKGYIIDNRYNVKYRCPICSGKKLKRS